MRYNPPPNWPAPPAGWTPPPGWRPDPSWPAVPPGWRLWVHDSPAHPYAATYPPYAPHHLGPHAGATFHPAARPPSNTGTVMIAVAAATCGLAGFVPPLWAARQRPDSARFRRRMYALAATSAALALVGFVLVGSAEEDATGSPTGVLSTLGTVLVLLNLIGSVAVAVLVRNTRPRSTPPGVAEELARRRLRDQYRRIVADDPALARSIGVGRPDLPRAIDDGGLIDLNAIPGDRLGPLTGLSAEEAARVVDARAHLGRFLSVEDLAVYADLPDATVDALRERVVFYGR